MASILEPRIVALVSDLIFQSKISGVAAHLGIDVQIVRTCPAAAAAAAAGATGLLIDLSANEDETVGLIALLKQGNPSFPIIGFFPHVQAELARRARAAGADEVLPRSRFTENLAEILRGLADNGAHITPPGTPAGGDSGAGR